MKKGQLVVFKVFKNEQIHEVINEYTDFVSVTSLDENSYVVGTTRKDFLRKANKRDIEKYLAMQLKKELIKNFTEVV